MPPENPMLPIQRAALDFEKWFEWPGLFLTIPMADDPIDRVNEDIQFPEIRSRGPCVRRWIGGKRWVAGRVLREE